MLTPCRTVKVALVLCLMTIGISGVARAQSGVCENATGAARGLCDAYCVHMQCNTPGKNASDAACRSIASQFERIAGVASAARPPGLRPGLRVT